MKEIKLNEQDLLWIKMTLTPLLGSIKNLYPDEQDKLSKHGRYLIYNAMYDGAIQVINDVLFFLENEEKREAFHNCWGALNKNTRKEIIKSWIKSCEE